MVEAPSTPNRTTLGDWIALVPQVPEMEHIDSWGFDVFKVAAVLSSRTMTAVGTRLFDEHALCVRFNIAPATLQAFLTAVEAGYRDNPYHNHLHAGETAVVMVRKACCGARA